jgi:hypothetical protein
MSYIYLMESVRDYDTVYKIGYSKKPSQRVKNVQTGNDGHVKVLYTFESKHGKKVERAVQSFYKHAHKNMEWFALDINDVCQFLPLCEKVEQNLDYLENFKIHNLYIEL